MDEGRKVDEKANFRNGLMSGLMIMLMDGWKGG